MSRDAWDALTGSDRPMEIRRRKPRRRPSYPTVNPADMGWGYLKFAAVVSLGLLLASDWNSVDRWALVVGVLLAFLIKLIPAWRAAYLRERKAEERAEAVRASIEQARTLKIRDLADETGLAWVEPDGTIRNHPVVDPDHG